jgi:hypothetical protein
MGDFEPKAPLPNPIPKRAGPDRRDQTHYVNQGHRLNSLRKLAGGFTRRFSGIFESEQSGEKQVILGQITEKYMAKMLAGLVDKRHTTMQMDPFTRSQAFTSLGYPSDTTDRPYEYAAMLYGLRELKREGVIDEQPNPDVEGTFWFKVINPTGLMEVANKDPQNDKSLSRELALMPGGEQERNAFVNNFSQENEVQLAA